MKQRRGLAIVVIALTVMTGSARADDPPPQGITDEEVKVILYNDLGVNGDMTLPWTEEDEAPDHLTQYQSRYLVRTIKALRRHFQARYETHGRTVRLIAVPSQSGLASSCIGRIGDAINIALDLTPFAVVPMGDGNMGCFVSKLAAEYGIPSYGAPRDVPQAAFKSNPGYVWSFMPDQQTQAGWSAGFICRSLKGFTAKHATDRLLQLRKRRFGIVYPQRGSSDWTRGPEMEQHAELLLDQTRQRCRMRWSTDPRPPDGRHLIARYVDAGSQTGLEAPLIMRRFKEAGVTTVMCYCVPVRSEFTVIKMQSAAAGLNYFPEYYFDHASRMDKAVWHREATTRLPHHSFGVSYYTWLPDLEGQFWYRAYLEEEPGTEPNGRFGSEIYDSLWTLFQAIGAGGTDPDVDSITAGLHTIAYRDLNNPFLPSGGFEPSKANPYSFVDSAMAWWWDPLGTEPNGIRGNGCIRLANEGRRSYANTWPRGDASLFTNPPGPCTGPPHSASP